MRQILFLIGVGTLLLFMTLTSISAQELTNAKADIGKNGIGRPQMEKRSMVTIDDEEDMLAMEDSSSSHESVSKVVMTRQIFGDDIPQTRPLSGNYLAYYIGFPHPSSRGKGKGKQLQHKGPRVHQENTFTNSHQFVYTGGDAAKLFQYPTSYVAFKNKPTRGPPKPTKRVNLKQFRNKNKNPAPASMEVLSSSSFPLGQEVAESSPFQYEFLPQPVSLSSQPGPVQLEYLPAPGSGPGPEQQLIPLAVPLSEELIPIPVPGSFPLSAAAQDPGGQLVPITPPVALLPSQSGSVSGPAPASPIMVPVPVIKHTPTGIKKVVTLPELAALTASLGYGTEAEDSDLQELFPNSGSALGPNEDGVVISFDFIHEPSRSNKRNKNTFYRRHQNLKLKQQQKNQQNHQGPIINMQRRDENQNIYRNQESNQQQRQQFQHQHQQSLAMSTKDQQQQQQQQQQQMGVPVPLPLLQRHLQRMRGMLSKISPLFSGLKVNRNGQIIQVPTSSIGTSTATIIPGEKSESLSSQLRLNQQKQQHPHQNQQHQRQQPQQQQQEKQQHQQHQRRQHEHPQQSKHQQQLKLLQTKQQKQQQQSNRMHPIGYKLAFENPALQ